MRMHFIYPAIFFGIIVGSLATILALDVERGRALTALLEDPSIVFWFGAFIAIPSLMPCYASADSWFCAAVRGLRMNRMS
jgi:hypothetical protein